MDSSKTKTLGPRLAVGFGLGGVLILSMIHPLAVALFASTASAIGTYELANAMRKSGWHVPRFPAAVAGLLIPLFAYIFGPIAQWLTLWVSVGLMVLWRVVYLLWTKKRQPLKQTLRDFGASAFAVIYVPLLLSFATVMLIEDNGRAWVFGLVFTVAMIDTFGYLFGRFFGKTKLSPAISPKKTWEGLFASIIGGFFGGFVTSLLTGEPLWFGFIFGAALLVSSVMGDLSESLIKRDLNVKDMGTILPGHGGVMDRIDSLLPSSFVAFLLSHLVLYL
ncbi:MAG: phosphatidate cytidylyltransferase [Aquiluna sp.]|nr:phosphatidate cytidylyltransferase [Aquiluna sp.]MCF8545276.1 phosphatidate cytidylyltransferase [Aquiluna sp.]